MNLISFSIPVDSSTLRFDVESDESHGAFSDDGTEQEYNYNNDSSSHTSLEQPDKNAGKKKKKRMMSNQSLQHGFDAMELNSSFDAILGHDADMNADQRMLDNVSTSDNRQPVTTSANSTQNRAADIDNVQVHMENALIDQYSIPEEEEELNEEMERRRILLREQEGNGANLERRLLAPHNEVQRRQPKRNQIDLLREKQLKLVDIQINLNEILVDTAKVVQEKERILLTQAKANGGENVNTNNSDE